MVNYEHVARKILKLGQFTDVHQVGSPSPHHEVDLHFTVAEPYIIGYEFYVFRSFGSWRIDYAKKPFTIKRADMVSVTGIRTQREMLAKVDHLLRVYRGSIPFGKPVPDITW